MPERIDLSRADDPRDVVHRVVACLAQGGVVGLPTEASYSLTASALHPQAVKRLQSLVGSDRAIRDGWPTLFLKAAGEVDDWADVSTEEGRRLTRRAWPGPVTLVFPIASRGLAHRLSDEVRPFLMPDGVIALRAPSHRLVREVLRLLPGPLVEVGVAAGASASVDDLAKLDELDMLLDNGPANHGGAATVVDIGRDQWSVVRTGLLSERVLARMASTILLFVCTGNTCRSPMAEALCKALLTKRLGCEPEELLDKGFVVLSAGVSAMDGMPAAANAVEVVKTRGASLEEHASRRASPDLVRQADHIIAMTADHLEILLDQLPEVASRARLLDARGEDIDDPVGCDLATYQRTARDIEGHITRFLDQLGI